MTRKPLPARRQSTTSNVRYDPIDFTVTVGFDDQGNPKEVFADGAKTGSVMAAMIADSCVAVSLLLQWGATPNDIAKTLLRVPDPSAGKDASRMASPLGVIVETIITEQNAKQAERLAMQEIHNKKAVSGWV
ncbi:MAG: hypothetical protein JKY31_13115 [Rhodobacteraceae bacterium]|nr:hypothetical protein [Paracoccaceae bacterium]